MLYAIISPDGTFHVYQVLYHFHTALNGSHHCSLRVNWRQLKPHCCGERSRLGEALEGRRPAVDLHAWPVWLAGTNSSACAHFDVAEPDLLRGRVLTWPRMGIPLDPIKTSLLEKA